MGSNRPRLKPIHNPAFVHQTGSVFDCYVSSDPRY